MTLFSNNTALVRTITIRGHYWSHISSLPFLINSCPKSQQVSSKTARAGECYYMPAEVLMTGANTGKKPARFFDIFDVSPGAPPPMTVREPVCFRERPGGKKVEYYRCEGQ